MERPGVLMRPHLEAALQEQRPPGGQTPGVLRDTRALAVEARPAIVAAEPRAEDLEAFVVPAQARQSPWRALGREVVAKILPAPERAAAYLAAIAAATSTAQAKAPGAVNLAAAFPRPDLIGLAVAVGALAAAASLTNHMKIPGTAPGMSRKEAWNTALDLRADGSTARNAALSVAQDHRRIAEALVTPWQALASGGLDLARSEQEEALLTGVIVVAEEKGYNGPMPKGVLSGAKQPWHNTIALQLATSPAPAVRQAFRAEYARWLADADGGGTERGEMAHAMSSHLDGRRPGEMRDLLELSAKALGEGKHLGDDNPGGPAEVVGVVLGHALRQQVVGAARRTPEGTEGLAFTVAARAARAFERETDLDRLTRATEAYVTAAAMEGFNPPEVARHIAATVRDLGMAEPEGRRLRAALLAGLRSPEGGAVQTMLRQGGLDAFLEDGPVGAADDMATYTDKRVFIDKVNAFEGTVPKPLAELAQLLGLPEQPVTVFALQAAMAELCQAGKLHSVFSEALNSAAESPAEARQLRMLDSLAGQFMARNLAAPAVFLVVLAASKRGEAISESMARTALADGRLAIIGDERRGLEPAPKKKEQSS